MLPMFPRTFPSSWNKRWRRALASTGKILTHPLDPKHLDTFIKQVIVYPTRKALKMAGAAVLLLIIWVVSLLLSLPNYLWRTLETHELNLPDLNTISFCFENWPNGYGRAIYSTFVMIVQYCLPIMTVGVAYARICKRLSYRVSANNTKYIRKGTTKEDTRSEEVRMRKTNTLLVSITLIFCLSWLPLNLFNMIVDVDNPFGDDTETMLVVYAVCHMVGMSSACSNPLLYGWLNNNFRKEFLEILSSCFPCIFKFNSQYGTNMLSIPTRGDSAQVTSMNMRTVNQSPKCGQDENRPILLREDFTTCNGTTTEFHDDDVSCLENGEVTTTML